jgi:DNA-binding LacI/PurR family transcriptional regulator
MSVMSKRVRIIDIAKEANVSIYSVSITLNGKAKGEVSEEIQKKILKAAEKLKYTKHREAVSLRTGKTFTVSLLISGKLSERQIIGNISLYQSIATITDTLAPESYFLNLLQLDSLANKKTIIKEITDSKCDGIILEPKWPAETLSQIQDVVVQNNIPCVITNEYNASLPCTYFDYSLAGYTAIKYLNRNPLGCIGVVNAEGWEGVSILKHQGIRKALSEDGVKTTIKQYTVPRPPNFTCGYQAGIELFREKPYPEAIFVTDNIAVPNLLLYLEKEGIRVPDDIEVLGLGDSSLAERASLMFSYIPIRIEEQSVAAAKMILQLIENKSLSSPSLAIPIEIVHADTTRPSG